MESSFHPNLSNHPLAATILKHLYSSNAPTILPPPVLIKQEDQDVMLHATGSHRKGRAALTGGFAIRCKIGDVVGNRVDELKYFNDEFRHSDYDVRD
jgi:hypothetical protein